MYRNNINDEFSRYLNRYLTGIILLKDEIIKLRLSYHLSEAYSNHACRMSIDVEMADFERILENKKYQVNKYFYNSYSETGSQFVSFIYKPQQSYKINLNEIRAFMLHYEFTQSLFEDFIKNIVPENCEIEIESLDAEPLFNYTDSFFRHFDYSEKSGSFSQKYFELNNRSFEFDCSYHNVLVQNANAEPIGVETITDKEIFKASGSEIEDIRRFVVDEKVPYTFRAYSNVINEINIQLSELKNKMKYYVPKSSFEKIYPKAILRLIDDKEREKQKQQKLFKDESEKIGISVGDLILTEDRWSVEKEYLGVVKNIRMSGSSLEIEYALLKNDLSESRLPLKCAESKNIKYTLKGDVFTKYGLKTKLQAISLLKKGGIRNPQYKTKIKKTEI